MRARARVWKLKAQPLPPMYLTPSDALSPAELDRAVESITVAEPADLASAVE
ncbi:hypothetical protein [Streptomyces tauricus]